MGMNEVHVLQLARCLTGTQAHRSNNALTMKQARYHCAMMAKVYIHNVCAATKIMPIAALPSLNLHSIGHKGCLKY